MMAHRRHNQTRRNAEAVKGIAVSVTATLIEREWARRDKSASKEMHLLHTRRLIMKLAAKLATAALLALSAAAPALATEPEAQTLAERNTYLYSADARPIAQHMQQQQQRAGTEAFAQAPGVSPDAGINANYGTLNVAY
jgi:hypothetical protein